MKINIKGRSVLIDKEDFNLISNISWCINAGYVVGYCKKSKKNIKMHRLVMGFPKGKQIDHKNRNTLDNRKINLRICSRQENMMNQTKQKRALSSKFKGVSLCKKTGKYYSYIYLNKKKYHLGFFSSEIDAMKAYNKKAKELFGDFARINKKNGILQSTPKSSKRSNAGNAKRVYTN